MADDGAHRAHARLVDKLFRIMTTAGEMVRDRKCIVAPGTIPDSIEDFKSRFERQQGDKKIIDRDSMTFLCENRDTREHMLVVFNGEDVFSLEHYKRYEEQARAAQAMKLIVIIGGKLPPSSKKNIEGLNRSEFAVKAQIFPEDDLVVNITHHELVPEHTPLTDTEVQEVLKAHSLEKQMLPRMLTTDPVAIYFGLEKGRVVKISRKSESAGKYVTYRQVV